MDARDRASILEDLASAHEELRRLAVERLALLPAEEALPSLLDRLGDPSWRVRKAAIERLAALPGASSATERLILALSDEENAGRRNAALEALICCGPAALPALLEASRSDDADLRKLVVDTLAGIGDAGAVQCLRELLADPDPNVRGAAADALGALADPSCVPALLHAARTDAERLVQLSALRALARLGAGVSLSELECLLDDPWLRPGAFAVLGQSDEEQALEHLVKGLACGSRTGREAAMEALLRIASRRDGHDVIRLVARLEAEAQASPEWVQSSVERLQEAALPERLMLVQFLGLLRRSEIVLPLLEAGRDEALAEVVVGTLALFGATAVRCIDAAWEELDTDLRVLACGVLGACEGAGEGASGLGVEARLLEGLYDSDPALRSAATRALAARRAEAALPALVLRFEVAAREGDLAARGEVEVLADAIVAVGSVNERARRRSVGLLSARIAEASPPVRRVAASVLGRLVGLEDVDALASLLRDPSTSVRRAALEALGRLRPRGLAQILSTTLDDESPFVRIAAASALAAAEATSALQGLGRLAADADARVRSAALCSIGLVLRACSERTVREPGFVLIAAGLRDEGPVALAAAESLRAAGGAEATRLSLGLLGHDAAPLVQAAVVCLAEHGDPVALEALLPLVAHPSWSVRSEVVAALAGRRIRKAVPALLRRLETEHDDGVRASLLRALERLEA